MCHWGLGELNLSWNFTLRDHELNHHTTRCIDMFSHDCHSDLMCVFSKKIPYSGIAEIDPQLALERQAKVVTCGM